MHYSTILPAVAALLSLASATAIPVDTDVESSDGKGHGCHKARIFALRGSSEPAANDYEGRMHKKLIPDILHRIKGSKATGIPYEAAAAGSSEYISSEQGGRSDLQNAIANYAKACPKSKIVVLGYSQGAQAAGDALIGTDLPPQDGYPTNGGLAQGLHNNIGAIALFGDPTRVAGAPWNKGTANSSGRSGVIPRLNSNNFDAFQDRLQSYCTNNDEVCDSGSSLPAHLHEISAHYKAAADFVVGKICNGKNSC